MGSIDISNDVSTEDVLEFFNDLEDEMVRVSIIIIIA